MICFTLNRCLSLLTASAFVAYVDTMGIEQAVAIESLLAQKTCGRHRGQYPGIIHPSRSNTVAAFEGWDSCLTINEQRRTVPEELLVWLTW
jgi:hypothetical protein